MWCSNRGRCSFLLEMRSAGGRYAARVSGVSATSDAALCTSSQGSAASANAGRSVVCVWRVSDSQRAAWNVLLSRSDHGTIRWRVAVWPDERPVWPIWPALDGRYVSVYCDTDRCLGEPGLIGRVQPSNPQTVGKDTGDHRRDPQFVEGPVWNRDWDL